MTDDTVRAAARPMPNAEKEETRNDKAETLDRAYARWLSARAKRKDPGELIDEESFGRLYKEEAAAARDFMLTPVTNAGYIWEKIEAFEVILGEELRDGPSDDSIVLLAFGALKQDLFNLNLGMMGGANV